MCDTATISQVVRVVNRCRATSTSKSWFSVNKAAYLSGLSIFHIRKMCRDGELEHIPKHALADVLFVTVFTLPTKEALQREVAAEAEIDRAIYATRTQERCY